MQRNGRTHLDELTRRVFEPRAGRPLPEEDLRQIAENLTGFFSVLKDWALREKSSQVLATVTTNDASLQPPRLASAGEPAPIRPPASEKRLSSRPGRN